MNQQMQNKLTKLNELLYKIHLERAKYWNVTWQYVQTATNAQLDKIMDPIHQNRNNKTGRTTKT